MRLIIGSNRFVMTVDALLGLDELLLHQDLLRQGKLLPYDAALMDGRVIFVSHQYVFVLVPPLFRPGHTYLHRHGSPQTSLALPP